MKFLSSFPTTIPLISFPRFYCIVHTRSTRLTRKSDRRYLSFLPVFVISLHLMYIVLRALRGSILSWFMKFPCFGVRAQSLQSCSTLCHPIDCSPPGSSVHRISQARIAEWFVAMPSSRGSSWPRDQTHVSWVSCIVNRFFTTEPLGKPNEILLSHKKEWNNAIHRNMDEPRDCHTKWSKSNRKREILYDIPYVQNLKRHDTNELIYKTKADSQWTNLWFPGEKDRGSGLDREFGRYLYTLLCLEWKTNKDLL